MLVGISSIALRSGPPSAAAGPVIDRIAPTVMSALAAAVWAMASAAQAANRTMLRMPLLLGH